MDWLRDYMITVTAASIICGILKTFFKGKGSMEQIGSLLTGLFLSVCVVSPWVRFQWNEVTWIPSEISESYEAAAASGDAYARKFYRDGISQRMEAYILDKAASLDAAITAEVRLSEDNAPAEIMLSGHLTPYQKAQLTELICSQLDIEREILVWDN